MFRNNKKLGFALAFAALVGTTFQAGARQNVGGPKPGAGGKKALLKTAAGCDPATASIDLDINNVRSKLMTGGDMWWDIGTGEARYEVPKGSKKNSLFAGSCWIGGFTNDGQLKVAAQTYRQDGNDYWPGPLNEINGAVTVDAATCSDWDRFWKVDKVTIRKFIETYKNGDYQSVQTSEFQSILEWPARGNGSNPLETNANIDHHATGTSGNTLTMDGRNYAPFVDLNGNGLYNPEEGEYPDIFGDQYIWWVFNDRGNTKQQSATEAIGMEVQASAFAFATKDFLNDATFYNYYLTNRSLNILDSTFLATWTDADLGAYLDDYIGCDTVRGLGILYNGNAIDGNGEVNSYGTNVPMVGVDFFRGPKRDTVINGVDTTILLQMQAFTYFNNNSDTRIGNPSNGVQIYNYMTGSSRNGQRFVNDFAGPGVATTALGQGPVTRFVFHGDPEKGEWAECVSGNPPFDRRFIHSAGPFRMDPGEDNNVTIGAVWVADVGGCPGVSFRKIRVADDQAQLLFDNGFKTIEGPEAPILRYREMDRKLVFYLVNPPSSNNFGEQYGYNLDSQKYRVAALQARKEGLKDSLYEFEGYRVFQLKNSSVQAAQIFDENGKINSDLAKEVFQCDIRNGVTQMVNWTKNIEIRNCDTCYDAVIKVDGKDSGIRHSFVLTNDEFSTAQEKRFVNYKTYYFVAIAYARNNFRNFDPGNALFTQGVVYLESNNTAGQAGLKVVGAMPNPGFQIGVGNALGADYGDGVVIKRMEGVGNGGRVLQLDAESEEAAMLAANGYQAKTPTYVGGFGPADVKVIDPVKVPKANWSLYIYPDTTIHPGAQTVLPGSASLDPYARLVDSTAAWMLVNESNNDTILYERGLSLLNEVILENYGLAVSIKQAPRPGDDQPNGNGYLTSQVIFADPAKAWLAGVPDGEQRSPVNWIRSGGNEDAYDPAEGVFCNYSDTKFDTSGQFYEGMLANSTFTASTWAPYSLGAEWASGLLSCGFGITKPATTRELYDLASVDVVFTSDKSKWTRCLVLEMSDAQDLAQNKVEKFRKRSHRSWTGDVDMNGQPIYSSTASDTGYSWFPGYAINQETGERLNIVFGEDSYQANANGQDMIWNPTSTIIDGLGNSVFGGKHYVYISKTKYDSCAVLNGYLSAASQLAQNRIYQSFIWTGMPTLATGFNLLSLKDGLIPTETRLRFSVSRPYAQYTPPGVTATNNGFPRYTFNTDGLAPTAFNETGNTDADKYMDRIHVVPNPYYASAGYEINRLDTRVRIVGLPKKATISVYSLDGSLIRRLTKDNSGVAYLDWDVRNAKGLPIASGMYLIHVEAEGLGEKIIRWFGAMRPVDITNF